MKMPTNEQTNASIIGEAQCCLEPRDLSIMRQHMLNLGATEEQADQAVRFWEEENRRNAQILKEKADLAKAS